MFKAILMTGLVLFGTSVSASAQHLRLRLHSRGAHVSFSPFSTHAPYSHRAATRGQLRHVRSGYYKTVTRKVWIEGISRQVHVPAQYGWGYDSCGRRTWIVVRPAYHRTVREPGHWDYRTERVWVPGRRHFH